MSNGDYDRREFLKVSAAGMGGADITRMNLPLQGMVQESGVDKPIRLGFVGIGGRGTYPLDVALGMQEVEVPAIYAIKFERLYTAKRWIEEVGQPTSRLYEHRLTDFNRWCEEKGSFLFYKSIY